MRVARGATSTWISENPPSLAFPPPPSCKEEDLEELHMNKDQGPRSSDAPHNYEEEEETPKMMTISLRNSYHTKMCQWMRMKMIHQKT